MITSKLMFTVNDFDYFLSHRLAIALAAFHDGYKVYLVCPRPPLSRKIPDFIEFVECPMSRNSSNPILELIPFFRLLFIFIKFRPDVLHLITVKAYLWGGLAARIARIEGTVSAVPGLGSLFDDENAFQKIRRFILSLLLKVALRNKQQVVIFQNQQDKEKFITRGILRSEADIRVIKGAGVDLNKWKATPEPKVTYPIVLMASRLLVAKGVGEFLAAADKINTMGKIAEFWIAGAPDCGGSVNFDLDVVHKAHASGKIHYLGGRDDVSKLMDKVNIVCLPSYYGEGVPKVLLEAAAKGRSVVTTDMPGCRDAIDDNITGFLVRPKDVPDLVFKLKALIQNPKKREEFGIAARKKAVSEFSVEVVVDRHLKIYGDLIAKQQKRSRPDKLTSEKMLGGDN